jgi:DNA-binding CsgD family transcriptional regulator
MVLTRTDENELLTALYAGVFDAPPWGLFLTRLRAKTDADICRIWLPLAGDTGAWREVQSAASRTAGDSPNGLAPFGDLRPGRVYGGAELGGMVATNGRYMRVSSSGGGDIAISMVRGASDFSARSAALLSDLAPHLSIALRTLTGLERAQLRGGVAAFAHARLAVGWLLLDDRGRILECDGLATEMLAKGTAMRQAGDGRLRLPYPSADTLLDMVMRSPEMLADGPRAAWLDLTPPVQIVFMAPAAETPPSLSPPACLALIRPVAGPDGSQWRMLSDLFGLTRSESALALRMANGEGIAEAGAALGLTVETARNYSKRIYAKIGARGQADLVRIIMAGVTGFV